MPSAGNDPKPPSRSLAVTEAHYARGTDPGEPSANAPLLAEHAPGVELPDIHDPDLTDAVFAEGWRLGIMSFPTFLSYTSRGVEELPAVYDPDAMRAEIARHLAAAGT